MYKFSSSSILGYNRLVEEWHVAFAVLGNGTKLNQEAR